MDLSGLSAFDILVLVIISLSTLLAFFNGVIAAVFSLIVWIGALLVTYIMFPYSTNFFTNSFNNVILAKLGASVGVFIIVFIVLAIISWQIRTLLRPVSHGVVDRSLGFAFGLLRGMLICSAIFFITNKLYSTVYEDKKSPKWLEESSSYNLLNNFTEAFVALMPGDVDKSFKKISESLPENVMDSFQSSPSYPEHLEKGEASTLDKIMASLPSKTKEDVSKRHKNVGNDSDDSDKLSYYRDSLYSYIEAVDLGTIKSVISDEELLKLKESLENYKIEDHKSNDNKNGDTKSDESGKDSGYNSKQINQIDRLVTTVEE